MTMNGNNMKKFVKGMCVSVSGRSKSTFICNILTKTNKRWFMFSVDIRRTNGFSKMNEKRNKSGKSMGDFNPAKSQNRGYRKRAGWMRQANGKHGYTSSQVRVGFDIQQNSKSRTDSAAAGWISKNVFAYSHNPG